MRSQRTPGAISCTVPAGGAAAWGNPMRRGRPRRDSCRAETLEHRGDALAHADAHGDERIASAGALQLPNRRQRKACARRAEGVTNGDGTAIGIDALVLEIDLEQLQATEHLAG